jgi:hypothetical protein
MSILSLPQSLQLQLLHRAPLSSLALVRTLTISAPTSPAAKRARLDMAAPTGPPGWAEDAQTYGSFKLLQRFPVPYAPIGIAKWRSEKTGLSVVVGSHQGEYSDWLY